MSFVLKQEQQSTRYIQKYFFKNQNGLIFVVWGEGVIGFKVIEVNQVCIANSYFNNVPEEI